METSGLILDRKLINTRQASWVNALNMYRNVTKDTIDVEPGFSNDELCIETAYPELGRIAGNNEYVLLCGDGINSQIVSSRKGVVIDDPLLGFSPSFPIGGVSTYNHKGEFVIAYTDNNKSPKILNIDNIPFELNDDFSITDPNKFTLLELFPIVTEPVITLNTVLGNGSLKSGVYYIVPAYAYSDESITNWLYKHNPVSITDDSNVVTFDLIDGCAAGTQTNKAIDCKISNLDTNFAYVYIAVISKINGIVSAFNYGKYPIDSYGTPINVIISSLTNATPVTLTEILSNNAIYTKVKTLTTLDNELLLGNVTGLPLLDFQQNANDIVVNWVREQEISLDGYKGSYKDPTTIFLNKTFRAGEVIGLLIGLKLKQTGTYALYHIPGRLAEGTDKDPIIDTTLLEIDEDLLKYQIEDTSTVNGDGVSGKMGFWENKNEVYPSWFPVDSNDNVFAGQPVRHHRMPSLRALNEYGQKFVDNINTAAETETIVAEASSLGVNTKYEQYAIYTPTITPTLGTLNTNGNKYTALFDQTVAFSIYIETINYDYLEATYYVITLTVKVYNASGAVIRTIANMEVPYNAPTYSYANNYNITLKAGEYIEYNVTSEREFYLILTDGYNCNIDFTLAINKAAGALAGTLNTKALGIKLDNIIIPENMLDYIDGYEIFYYERDNDNMTILDQDVIDMRGTGIRYSSGTDDEIKFHGFQALSNQINPTPRYISIELELTPTDKTLDSSDPDLGSIGYWNAVNNGIASYAGTQKILVNSILFVPAHNNATIYDNLYSEDSFIIKLHDDVTNSLTKLYLYNLCAYKTDMYYGFLTRRVVSTGQYVKINPDLAIQETLKVYGGDTFISKYSYLIYNNSTDENDVDFDRSFTRVLVTIPYESTSNVGFRHEGIQPHEKYYPKTDLTELAYDSIGNLWSGVFKDIWQAGNSYLYNTDYNSINNITSPFIWNNSNNFVVNNPTLIHRSLPMNTESTEFKWRVMPARNYYVMPFNKGEIVKLLAHGRAIFIGMRNSTYKAFVKDLLSTLNTDAYLTKGDIFDREPTEIIDSNEGIIGVQNQECMISTPHGVLILDRDQAKLYLLNEAITPLSQGDVYEYLKEHLTFNEEYTEHHILLANVSTYIEASAGVALTWSDSRTAQLINSIDNIYQDKGVILGYEITDSTRFLITARNKDFYPGSSIAETAALINKPISEIGYYPSALQLNILSGNVVSISITFGAIAINLVEDPIAGTGTFIRYADPIEQAIGLADSIAYNMITPGLSDNYRVQIIGNTIYIVALQEGSDYDMVVTNFVTTDSKQNTAISHDFVTYYDKSFTLSYSFDNKYWVSRHSYKPTSYIQLRKGTYIVDGHALIHTNKVYNISKGYLGTYSKFTGTLEQYLDNTLITFPAYIDMAFNFKDGQNNYIVSAVTWITKGYNGNKLDLFTTFSKIMAYNETQCSGYITLVHVNGKQVGTLEGHNGNWYCNQFKDLVMPDTDIDILDNEFEPLSSVLHDGQVTTLINGNTYLVYDADVSNTVTYNGRVMNYNGAKFTVVNNDTSYSILGTAKIKNVKNWFDMSEISSKLAVIRLYTDNTQLTDLKLLQIAPIIKTII